MELKTGLSFLGIKSRMVLGESSNQDSLGVKTWALYSGS